MHLTSVAGTRPRHTAVAPDGHSTGGLMGAYILRRLLLMIPTIIGIMAISFAVIQFAPGGPVEQVIAQLTGQGDSATDRISGGGGDDQGFQSQEFGDS
jgi:microcin C transport system permease protein